MMYAAGEIVTKADLIPLLVVLTVQVVLLGLIAVILVLKP